MSRRITQGASLPVVLRIYPLKGDRPFATATYVQLIEGNDLLKASTVWGRDMVLGPGQTLKIFEPIGDEVTYIGVATFFRGTANAERSVRVPKSL